MHLARGAGRYSYGYFLSLHKIEIQGAVSNETVQVFFARYNIIFWKPTIYVTCLWKRVYINIGSKQLFYDLLQIQISVAIFSFVLEYCRMYLLTEWSYMKLPKLRLLFWTIICLTFSFSKLSRFTVEIELSLLLFTGLCLNRLCCNHPNHHLSNILDWEVPNTYGGLLVTQFAYHVWYFCAIFNSTDYRELLGNFPAVLDSYMNLKSYLYTM